MGIVWATLSPGLQARILADVAAQQQRAVAPPPPPPPAAPAAPAGPPAPRRSRSSPSTFTDRFTAAWRAAGGPALVAEHRFHAKRRWRFDFVHLGARVAIELEGGVFTGGRHTRPRGFIADCEKYNAAAAAGWRVFRLATGMIKPEALEPIVQAIRTL